MWGKIAKISLDGVNYLVVPKNMKDGFRMAFAKGACVFSENISIIEEIFCGEAILAS